MARTVVPTIVPATLVGIPATTPPKSALSAARKRESPARARWIQYTPTAVTAKAASEETSVVRPAERKSAPKKAQSTARMRAPVRGWRTDGRGGCVRRPAPAPRVSGSPP